MFKYLLATVVGLVAVSTSSAQPIAAQPEVPVYELRTYTAGAGRLGELHTRFREHTIRLLEKHGATSLGYWEPADNPDNKLLFLLSYPSQTARDRTWSTLVADPEWQRVKQSSEVRQGKLVERIESSFLTTTAYSPTVRAVRDSEKREFELRTATAKAGQSEALHTKLRSETLPNLERNGTTVLGVWTVRQQTGTDTTVMYLVARKPESDADSMIVSLSGVGMRRPALRPDPTTMLLRATDYSPMK